VSDQESERLYICIRGMDFASFCYFSIGFGMFW